MQTGRHQVISQPESRRRIHGIRLIVSAIIAIPRRSSPTPAVGDRSGPRVICPSVVCRPVIIRRIVTVIGISSVVVALIDADAVTPVVVVRP